MSYYPASTVQIRLKFTARVQDAYRLYRAGRLSLWEAVKYPGPSFKDKPEAERRLHHFIGGSTVNICIRDTFCKTETRYVYPIHTIHRVKVQ